jgi:protease IV
MADQQVVFAHEQPEAGLSSGSPRYFVGVAKMMGNIFFAIIAVFLTFGVAGIGISLLAAASGEENFVAELPNAEYLSGKEESSNLILSIPISGTILNESSGDFFGSLDGATYGYEIQEQLKKAATYDSVKAVVLEIDSPGGTIVGSDAIVGGVGMFKKLTNKPVFAFVNGVAASGGYMAAIAADKVFAAPGSTVGSIGVIFGPFTYYDKPVATDGGLFGGGVTTQGGIEQSYITSGTSKDIGNPFRRLTDAERNTLQEGVASEYENFVEWVKDRRKLEPAFIKDRIGAMVYSNAQAQALNLIDGTWTRQEVYDQLGREAKVDTDFKVVRMIEPSSSFADLLGAAMVTAKVRPSGASVVQADLCAAIRQPMLYSGNAAELCK